MVILLLKNETNISQSVKITQSRNNAIKNLEIPANTTNSFTLEKGFQKEITTENAYKYHFAYDTNNNTWIIINAPQTVYTVQNNLPITITLQNFPNVAATSPSFTISVPAFSFSNNESTVIFSAYPEEIYGIWKIAQNQQQTGEPHPYITFNGEQIGYAIIINNTYISINQVINY